RSDIHSAAQRLRKLAEYLRHLHGRLEVKLVGLEFHSIRVAHGRAGLDAEQDVLGVSVVVMDVMPIVGGDDMNTGLFRKTDQFAVDILFDRQPLILDLEEE